MKMNKKGITLVEVIVVLIIMAVLAGILVASYTGYIDKAKQDSILVEARAAYLAASTLYHEAYSAGTADKTDTDVSDVITDAKIQELAGVSGNTTDIDVKNGKIDAMVYTSGDYKCTLTGGVTWTVAPKTTP
jgi:prepilin-type N-terminal cleavage/methylation domain-containing protein